MSHIAELQELKNTCDTTSQCDQYHTRLNSEYAKIDAYTAEANTTAAGLGALGLLIGLAILCAAFIMPIRRALSKLFPILLVIAPVVLGLGLGLFAGFLISFSACFKQSCSPVEEGAMYLVPLLSLIPTVPLAIFIGKNRRKLSSFFLNMPKAAWIVDGAIVIAIAIALSGFAIADNINGNERQKQYLLKSVNDTSSE